MKVQQVVDEAPRRRLPPDVSRSKAARRYDFSPDDDGYVGALSKVLKIEVFRLLQAKKTVPKTVPHISSGDSNALHIISCSCQAKEDRGIFWGAADLLKSVSPISTFFSESKSLDSSSSRLRSKSS